MKSNLMVGVLALLVIGTVGVMGYGAYSGGRAGSDAPHKEKGIAATVYKSPSCGCCGNYVAYLGREGYDVSVEERIDMTEVKKEHRVPYALESCHTMVIEGYVVEGHVPEAAIAKLLFERPDIQGIALAGMPSGSPGMPGPQNGDFMVYEILRDGSQGDVFVTL